MKQLRNIHLSSIFRNRSVTLRIVKIGTISLFALIIAAYAIWRSFNYVSGPAVDIFQPMNGSAIATSTVEIIGRAYRVNSLSLNGQTITVDEAGNFSQTIIVFPGMNILTFHAHDQFGRDTDKQLQLFGSF